MLCEILVLMIIIWLLKRQWLMRRQVALARKLKTNLRSYPFIGHAWMFLGTEEDRMRAFEAFGRDAIEVGGISKVWLGGQLFICVADPVVAKILTTQCLEKHELMNIFQFLLGNASFLAPVPIWRPRRKIVAPIFSSKYFSQFMEVFAKKSAIMADLLQKEAGKGAFSFWDYIITYTTDAVSETTLGVQINAHTVMKYLDELCRIGAVWLCQPWFYSDFMLQFRPSYGIAVKYRDSIWNYIAEIIAEKRKIFEEKKNHQTVNEEVNIPSFFDLQMEASRNGRRLTDRELLEEAMTLIIGASDTTASTSSFVVLMLSRHQVVQEKIYKELQEVFGDSNRPVTLEDLPRLKYLEAVIKETLRLFPPGPVIVRQVDKDVTLPSGLTIVQGCGILINIWAINRNPEYWGADAEQFRPERFLDYTPKHPAAFMSFSYGPRGCSGNRYAMMSMKTVASTLLRRYRVLPPPGVLAGDPLRTTFEVMLRDADNYQIRLEERIRI